MYYIINYIKVKLKLIIYLFNLRPEVLIKTLSHIWGKLNLPTLLFKVGLLTLINIDSFIYLDKEEKRLNRSSSETIDGLATRVPQVPLLPL